MILDIHKLFCLYFLAEVSNQMLELYEQNKAPPSQGSEVEGSAGGATRAAAKEPAVSEDQVSEQMPPCSTPQNSSAHEVPPTSTENQSNDGSTEMGSVITDHKLDVEIRDSQLSDGLPQNDNERELADGSNMGTQRIGAGDPDRIGDTNEAAEVQRRDDLALRKSFSIGQNLEYGEGSLGQSPKEAIKMIDKDKVKAALEKTRKARREITLKKDDVMDEDEFIERELEDGVELGVDDEKHVHMAGKQQSCKEVKPKEEVTDDTSTLMNKHKRKARHSPDGQPEGKRWLDPSYDDELVEDVSWKGGVPYQEGNRRRPDEEGHC